MCAIALCVVYAPRVSVCATRYRMYTPNRSSHEVALSMRCVTRMCSRSFKEAVACKVRRFEPVRRCETRDSLGIIMRA